MGPHKPDSTVVRRVVRTSQLAVPQRVVLGAADHPEASRGVAPSQPDTTRCGCGGCTVVRLPPHGGLAVDSPFLIETLTKLPPTQWRWCDGFVVVMAWIYSGGDGGKAAVVGDESGKGVSWWDGADVMVTAVERE
ncbi:hypothetical protein Tco_1191317 [Tanacetum coccineum]